MIIYSKIKHYGTIETENTTLKMQGSVNLTSYVHRHGYRLATGITGYRDELIA
jgi:hypothetical protein